MHSGEPLGRPGMEHARGGQPTGSQATQPRPGPAVALTAMPQLRVPQAGQPNPKGKQAVEVPRYRVVVEVALHDRLEPLPGFRHRVMPASLELLLDLAQLGPQTLGDGPALHGKVPLPVLPAHMREPQKVER